MRMLSMTLPAAGRTGCSADLGVLQPAQARRVLRTQDLCYLHHEHVLHAFAYRRMPQHEEQAVC